MPSTFGPGLAVDPVTLAPVPNAPLRVLDMDGTIEYTTQDLQGDVRPVFTDHRGQYPQFQIAEGVPAALLVSPPYMQRMTSLETLQGASQAIAELERLTVSHVALDTDGTPFFSPGSASARLLTDSDGVPYVVPA